jgi:hypothetical protein
MLAASGSSISRSGFAPSSWLTASSTRHDGLVQLTDVTPTVLTALGAPVAAEPLVGAVMESAGGRPRDTGAAVESLAAQDTAAQLVRDNVGSFFALFGVALLIAVIVGCVAAGRHLDGLARAVRAALVVLAAVPVATFLANLVPWWSAGAPTAVLAAMVIGWAVLVGGFALLGPWRRHPLGPPGAVAAVTGLVLTADVVAGSPLQYNSLLGLSPLVAGRFYGFGNVAFAVFAMAAVFAATWAAGEQLDRAGRRWAVLAVGAIGAVAVVADGWPAFGSDFGGVLAMVPGFALLGLAVSGRRLSAVRAVVVAAAAVATVAVIATLDWLRPAADRSHLGRFVQQVLDGEAAEVIGRKATANLNSFGNPFTLLIPVLFVLLALLVLRPELIRATVLVRAYERVPVLRAGLGALFLTAVVGFAVNDSGVMVPAVALTAAVPLGLAAVLAAAPAAGSPART